MIVILTTTTTYPLSSVRVLNLITMVLNNDIGEKQVNLIYNLKEYMICMICR